jgi:hypothetical protein
MIVLIVVLIKYIQLPLNLSFSAQEEILANPLLADPSFQRL